MRHLTLSSILMLSLVAGAGFAESPMTIKRIMNDPDWLGTPPRAAFWAEDGQGMYFTKKRIGDPTSDLWLITPEGEARVIEAAERHLHGTADGAYDATHARKAFVRDGELYLQVLPVGPIRQLTRSGLDLRDPVFLTDGRIAVRGGDRFYAWSAVDSRLDLIADLKLEKDPTAPGESAQLAEQQKRLFQVLRDRADLLERIRERDRLDIDADPGRPSRPWYLGADIRLVRADLSPNGRWLLVVTTSTQHDAGKPVRVADLITKSGYLEDLSARPKVGTATPVTVELTVLDLNSGVRIDIDTSILPGIDRDPLRRMRERAELPALEGSRPVAMMGVTWNRDGTRAALMFRALDNKDRWIATLQPGAGFTLTPRHRLTDEAWINWYTGRSFDWFNDFGFLPDDTTLWYLSEESGHSHLYLHGEGQRRPRQLTRGEWEVSHPVLTRDGSHFVFVGNREHPGIHEVYRVRVADGGLERLTRLEGRTAFVLSPAESRLLLTSSVATRHDELLVQAAAPGATATRLTHTMSEEFLAYPWIAPEIVAIPSTHQRGAAIHTRVYLPHDYDPNRAEPYPAVMFAHGAGYLQNAHHGWSSYFREFMFHTYLVERGYVVFDMDFRASSGYGRDWRTAIYRRMGTPEVEDFKDGVAWMVANRNVDPGRVGIYGGSYGGFVAFMSLFRAPGLFAAGAALRPVADWMYYHQDYTANILNTPQLDPEAYRESSPIEYAEGLDAPLLLLLPMVDTNVLFQDSVRLVQRLIELEKTEWFETAIYPVENHGFIEPSSWLDEYRRIFMLFERHLR